MIEFAELEPLDFWLLPEHGLPSVREFSPTFRGANEPGKDKVLPRGFALVDEGLYWHRAPVSWPSGVTKRLQYSDSSHAGSFTQASAKFSVC